MECWQRTSPCGTPLTRARASAGCRRALLLFRTHAQRATGVWHSRFGMGKESAPGSWVEIPSTGVSHLSPRYVSLHRIIVHTCRTVRTGRMVDARAGRGLGCIARRVFAKYPRRAGANRCDGTPAGSSQRRPTRQDHNAREHERSRKPLRASTHLSTSTEWACYSPVEPGTGGAVREGPRKGRHRMYSQVRTLGRTRTGRRCAAGWLRLGGRDPPAANGLLPVVLDALQRDRWQIIDIHS